MDDISTRRLLEKLAPEKVQHNLVRASLLILAFELLKDDIVNGVKSFFLIGMDNGKDIYSDDYENEVLPLSKYRFEASCKWLESMSVLTDDDISELQKIREHRNEIAHDLASFIAMPEKQINIKMIERIKHFLEIVGKFWVRIEIDINMDIDKSKVDYEGSKTGKMILMDYILSFIKLRESN